MNDDKPLLDDEVLEVLHDAIGDGMPNIVKMFLDDVPQNIAQMQKDLQQNDYTSLRRNAHSLKSSSANLGAMQLSALATELELSISDNAHDVNIISDLITKIKHCFDQTRPLFSKYT